MAEIINLRRARKAKARDAAEKLAAANRVVHGRTRLERNLEAGERRRRDALLDGAAIGLGGDNVADG